MAMSKLVSFPYSCTFHARTLAQGTIFIKIYQNTLGLGSKEVHCRYMYL